MDHRLAMSALMMGLGSDQLVGVDDAAIIRHELHRLRRMMRSLGGDFS